MPIICYINLNTLVVVIDIFFVVVEVFPLCVD